MRVMKHWNTLPRTIQGQVGQGFQQPGLVEDVPVHCRGGWTRRPLKVPSNPNHSMIPHIPSILPHPTPCLLWCAQPHGTFIINLIS